MLELIKLKLRINKHFGVYMIKQIYRFITLILISNFFFSPAIFGKSTENTAAVKSSNQNNTPNEQESRDLYNREYKENQGDIDYLPPVNKDNSGKYTTLYGVTDLNDFFNSYQLKDQKQNADNKH